jgi:transcriptional regulator with XRE-family HTH domain
MKCDKCGGTGKALNHLKLGRELRLLRKKHRIPLMRVADLMGFTRSYLSELELGKRNWSASLETQYRLALSLEVKK